MALFNAGEAEAEVTAELPFGDHFVVTDEWNGTVSDTAEGIDSISAVVKPHGAQLFKLTRV